MENPISSALTPADSIKRIEILAQIVVATTDVLPEIERLIELIEAIAIYAKSYPDMRIGDSLTLTVLLEQSEEILKRAEARTLSAGINLMHATWTPPTRRGE
ncbi:MAG: hypothetical protein ACKVW3_16640 [Phycisphaerales bacterium]